MILLFPLFHLNSLSFKRCVAIFIDNRGIGIIISVSLQISVSGFWSALFAKMRNSFMKNFSKMKRESYPKILFALITNWREKANCSDPHFSGEGGTIYSTGFFLVQSILADRYIHRRELIFRVLQGAIEV